MPTKKYTLSFTACSLKVNEMSRFLRIQLGLEEVDTGGKESSASRKNREFRKRVEALTTGQRDALINGDATLQRQIAYLSVCKSYDFFREFVIEVLREKMLLMDTHVTEGEYLSFYRRKAIDHEELELLSQTTEKKTGQVIFRILSEAGIINSASGKELQYQILDPKLVQLIESDNPKWLKIFLLNDYQISHYTRNS